MYEYRHVNKIGINDTKADREIRTLLSDGWEFDVSADTQLLVFDSQNPELEIPAAKYTFKRKIKRD